MNEIIKDLFALILSSFINYNTMSILYYFKSSLIITVQNRKERNSALCTRKVLYPSRCLSTPIVLELNGKQILINNYYVVHKSKGLKMTWLASVAKCMPFRENLVTFKSKEGFNAVT